MDYAIAVHAGAVESRRPVEDKIIEGFRRGLADALARGRDLLEDDGSALDAVETAVRAMEDCPLFNAGRGASLSATGAIQMDAAIMDGRDLGCGAVIGLKHVINPVRAARLVMERTPHALFTREAAERLAKEHGLPTAPVSHFVTERSRRLRKAAAERARTRRGHGTVGAVALDRAGHLAAATSTGGVRGGMSGRVGDTPIIGAGTYADDATCAVSCTGWGEEFIRHAAAARVSTLVRHAGMPLPAAAEHVICQVLGPGDGGLIAVSEPDGAVICTTTETMACAFADSTGRRGVYLWRDEIEADFPA